MVPDHVPELNNVEVGHMKRGDRAQTLPLTITLETVQEGRCVGVETDVGEAFIALVACHCPVCCWRTLIPRVTHPLSGLGIWGRRERIVCRSYWGKIVPS